MLTNIVSDMMRDSRLVSEFAQDPEQFLQVHYPDLSARARRALVSRSLAETLRTINTEIEEYLAGAQSPALRYGGLPELNVTVSPCCGPVRKALELTIVATASTGVLPDAKTLDLHFEFADKEVRPIRKSIEASPTRIVFLLEATFPVKGAYQLVITSPEIREPYLLNHAFVARED